MDDYIIDMMNSEAERRLADMLNITYDELNSLSFEIETDQSDDGLIYRYRVEFSDDSPNEILNKIERLEKNGRTVHLEPWELDSEYDYDEQFEAIIENKNYLEKFETEISNLETLVLLKIPDDVLKSILNRQIYIGVIGTMETFLSEAFLNLTFDNDIYFRNFIETHPEFKQRKFELREIFAENEKLRETAKKVIIDTIFHNLPSVSLMFKDTFQIEFPQIKIVYEHVLKRHDLVHRNGKTKEGLIVETDDIAIDQLIKDVRQFVLEIASILKLN